MAELTLHQQIEAATEQGNTLVEVLVALVILGLTVTAVLGNLLTTTSVSEQHRGTANFGAALASFAETVRNATELQAYNGSGTGPQFSPCGTSYTLVGDPIPSSGPPGTVVTVLGTGFTPAAGVFSGAKFGSLPGFVSHASTSSGPNGDIAQFTVPASASIGSTYSVMPFDGTHSAATSFTVTAPPAPSPAETISGDALTFDTFTVTCTTVSSSVQQLQLDLADNQPNNGSGARQTIDVVNLNPQGLPTPPVSLAVTTPASGQLKLTWYPPTYQGLGTVTSFNIYRSTTSGGPWGSPIGSVLSNSCSPQCSYTDTGRSNGTVYFYEVTAVSTTGESQPSVQGSGTTLPGTPPTPSTTSGTGQVGLSWSAPANGNAPITGYNVYCSTTSGTGFTKVNSSPISGTSYTDTMCNSASLVNGNTYYFNITAVNAGGEGPSSGQATGVTLPGTPQSVAASPGNGSVSISWTAPTNGNAPITGYNIYCSTTSGVQGPKVNSSPVSSSPYNDTLCNGSAISNHTKYYFEVTAVNSGGESVPPAQVSATAGAPTAPQGLTASGNSSHVTLSWSAPASTNGSPLTGYNIYRSTTPTMPSTVFQSVGSGTTTYTDNSVSHGTTYYYWVTAVNANGESPPASTSRTP